MLKFPVFVLFIGYCYADSIEIPVKSRHELKVIPVSSSGEEHVTNVEVSGGALPVYMLFKTESSPLYVKQQHKGEKGSFQKSDSKDEPHQLVHEVVKPVIQELNEFITPLRQVMQVIEPVKEEKLTLVHKGEGKVLGYANNGGYGKAGPLISDIGYGKIDEGLSGSGNSVPLVGDIGYGKMEESSLGYKGLESGMVTLNQGIGIGLNGQLDQIDDKYKRNLYENNNNQGILLKGTEQIDNRYQDILKYDNNQGLGSNLYEQGGNINQGILGYQSDLGKGYSRIEQLSQLDQLCKNYRTMTLADLVKYS